MASRADSLYIAPLGEEAAFKATVLCEQLRSAGIACETDVTGRSAKAQLKYADKNGHTYVAVIGTDELEKGECELKNLRTGEKRVVGTDADPFAEAILE